MKSFRLVIILAVVLTGVLPASVLASPPPLPSSFYGTVKLDGANAPAGTPV